MENIAVVIRKNEIVQIPISQIRPSPFQPRAFFDRDDINELADSIRQYGILQPICVRCLNKYSYEIVFGERRFKAAKLADMFYVPCIIADIGDKDSAVISLAENIQKQSLNFFDEAKTIFNLIEDFGCSISEVSKIIGKNERYIINKIKLLRIKYYFRRIIIDNNISEEHTLEIIRIFDDDVIYAVLGCIIKFDLNIKKTKKLIENILKRLYMGSKVDKQEIEDIVSEINRDNCEQKVKVYVRDLKIFTNTIYQAVETMNKSGVKTMCTFDENDDSLEVYIKVNK